VLTLRWCLTFVTIVAVAGVCAPGCERRDVAAPPAAIRIGVGAPPTENRRSGFNFVVDMLSTETWMTMRPDGSISDRLANRWTWDDSHTRLRLSLRTDVLFHDGTQLTGELAARSLRESVAEGANYSFSSVQEVTPVGPSEVELRLSAPNSFVVPDLALTSVRLPANRSIGTGPFRIASVTEQLTLLEAFPKYYRGRPGLSQIEVANYPRQRNAWAAMMRGEIDMLHEVSREAAEFVEAETTVKTYSFQRPYYIPLVFNVRHPILKRAEVRIAINQALDRVALVRDGMNGRGRPADGPIWPQHWAYTPDREAFVYNPESARRRLDAAGIVDKPASKGTAPGRFSFTCLFFADDARFDRLAVLVQKQLAEAGIDMKLVPLSQKALTERIKTGNFDAFIFEMAGRSLSWVYEFWRSHKGSMNNTGYVAADATLDRLRAARSDDEIRAGIAELGRILHNDPPAAFLAWQVTTRAVSTHFDVAAEENRDILSSIWQWRPAEAPRK